MTRSTSGRGPKSTRGDSGRSGAVSEGQKPTAGTPGGSRVTLASDGASSRKPRRRLVQVAAIAFAILLVVAMALGCAKYDGDQAAFCAGLVEVPTFMQLASRTAEGSSAEASAAMHAGAKEFRGLERVAPRKIRATVAKLGDSAERIADRMANESTEDRIVRIVNADGSVTEVPVQRSVSQDRLGVFYNEMANHYGTVSAMYSLASYAHNVCGITDENFDLGLVGYGAFDDGSVVGGPFSGGFSSPPMTVTPDTTVP